jgi:hypothetical protein
VSFITSNRAITMTGPQPAANRYAALTQLRCITSAAPRSRANPAPTTRMQLVSDGGKQIWATEFGAATSKVDEATQAAWIQDFLTTWRGLDGAGPADVVKNLA